jgi:acyl-CoA thioester hydrolase
MIPKRTTADYKHFHEDILRFGDMDLAWHVDHSIYVSLFQGARIEFWRWADHNIFGPENVFVLVHYAMDIDQPIEYPDRPRIGTRIAKMGGSSVTYDQAMFNGKGQLCAVANVVNVQVDLKTNKAVPWDPALKARLLAL